MAESLPFNEWLRLGDQPSTTQIELSLFASFELSSRGCNFIFFNPRNGEVHSAAVEVQEVRRDEKAKLFWLKGKIKDLDGTSWQPPASTFESQYDPHEVRRSRFMIVKND